MSTPAENKTSENKTSDVKWYIVKTKANCEAKAKSAVQRLVEDKRLTSHVADILVPEKEVVEVSGGKKVTRSKRIYPGYVFIKMQLTDPLWHLIKSASHVINFVGRQGRPAEVPAHQIENITEKIQQEMARPHSQVDFSAGEAVKVIDGPFKTFSGVVEEVNQEKARVKVSVSIFGRPTPVELDFSQVHREE